VKCTLAALGASSALLLPVSVHAAGATAAYWGTTFAAPGASGETTPIKTPTTVALHNAVVQVGTSNSDQYALLSDGTVWAWGWGNEGQLGDGGTVNSFTTPVQVAFPAGVIIASLATDVMPYDAAYALDTNGNAWGWGAGENGVMCLGRHGNGYLTPVKLPFTDVTSIAGASGHVSVDSNGSVYSCGANSVGQLGIGTTSAPSYIPVAVSALANVGLVTLEAGSVDEAALLANGTVYEWGDNVDDQVGNGTSGGYTDAPYLVPLEAPAVKMAVGGDAITNGSTLVILADGTLWSWGCDNAGQLGNDAVGNQSSPIEFAAPAGVTYISLAESGATSYGLTAGGAVYSWGQGGRGQIGNGHLASTRVPVMVIAAGETQISATAQEVEVTP
jgi:alpha-tubulin suppressor-like RCC1 family protein